MQLNLKPSHAAVKAYYAVLNQFGQLHFDNEAQVSDAFARVLSACGRKLHLSFVPQFPIERGAYRLSGLAAQTITLSSRAEQMHREAMRLRSRGTPCLSVPGRAASGNSPKKLVGRMPRNAS